MPHADDATAVAPAAFRPCGARGTDGFFRAVQEPTGHWWLRDPEGEPFFVRAVHGAGSSPLHIDGALPIDTAARLRNWNFNTLGCASEPAREDGLPFFATAEFCRAGHVIAAPGVRLPDVFDPEWPQCAKAHAATVCGPLAGERALIGWVTDDGLAWAPPTFAGRPSLLQLCLSLEPGFAAYHAAWEFALALHGGRLEALAHAWNTAIPNREVVRELTRAEEGIGTRGYLRDDARWTAEFARRYFATTAAAIRDADPNHLVLGCRFRGPAGVAVLTECTYPAVDVTLAPWLELPPTDAAKSQPVIASDVCWVDDVFAQAPTRARVRRLTTLERMLKRARAALERAARHPAVVGYAWAQWQDEPGEQPPFAHGLIHVNGAEAREHTELLAAFNLRAESLRRAAAAKSLS